jgi:hypothetical protein
MASETVRSASPAQLFTAANGRAGGRWAARLLRSELGEGMLSLARCPSPTTAAEVARRQHITPRCNTGASAATRGTICRQHQSPARAFRYLVADFALELRACGRHARRALPAAWSAHGTSCGPSPRVQSRRRCGRGEPQSRSRCGRGEPQSRSRCGRWAYVEGVADRIFMLIRLQVAVALRSGPTKARSHLGAVPPRRSPT